MEGSCSEGDSVDDPFEEPEYEEEAFPTDELPPVTAGDQSFEAAQPAGSSDDDDLEEELPNYDDEGEAFFNEGEDALAYVQGIESGPAAKDAKPADAHRPRQSALEALRSAQDQGPNQATARQWAQDPGFGGEEYLGEEAFRPLFGLGKAPGEGRKRTRRRATRRRGGASARERQLDEEVSAKLGEANLKYASNEHEDAIRILKDVVRSAPNVPDSYFTLGIIHESLGDMPRALDFYLLGLTIQPKEEQHLRRAASIAEQIGRFNDAIELLKRVSRIAPSDVGAKERRAYLLEETGNLRRAAKAYVEALQAGSSSSESAERAARALHGTGQSTKGASVLEEFVRANPNEASLTLYNILGELYMVLERWDKCLSTVERAMHHACKGHKPPIELVVKRGIALLHLGEREEARAYIEELYGVEADEYSDLLLEAAEICRQKGEHDVACCLYGQLHKCPETDGPEIWKMVEEEKRVSEGVQAALSFYGDLQEKHPESVRVNVAFADLLAQEGNNDFAENLARSIHIPQATSDNVEDCIRLAMLYRSLGHSKDFLAVALPVVSQSIASELVARGLETEDYAERHVSRGEGWIAVPSLREGALVDGIFSQKWSQLIGEVINALAERAIEDADNFLHAITKPGKRALGVQRLIELVLMRVVLRLRAGLYEESLEPCKSLCELEPKATRFWNLFAFLANASSSFGKCVRFVSRMRGNDMRSGPVLVLSGHFYSMKGDFVSAVGEYVSAAKVAEREPLPALCAATSLLQIAVDKHVADRHHAVVRAFAFLCEYRRLRDAGAREEVEYNFGRAFHQLGLLHLAVKHYRRALGISQKGLGGGDGWAPLPYESVTSTQRLAAHNLALIYRNSGAAALARSLRRRFITI